MNKIVHWATLALAHACASPKENTLISIALAAVLSFAWPASAQQTNAAGIAPLAGKECRGYFQYPHGGNWNWQGALLIQPTPDGRARYYNAPGDDKKEQYQILSLEKFKDLGWIQLVSDGSGRISYKTPRLGKLVTLTPTGPNSFSLVMVNAPGYENSTGHFDCR
jgi:hypothetical protein